MEPVPHPGNERLIGGAASAFQTTDGAGATATSRRPIVVAGEALVNFVLECDGTATPHLGGGPFNAARSLGRLGLRPLFLSRLSCDRHGRALRKALERSGVRLDAVVSTDAPTTFARVEIDGTGDTSYRFYADGTSFPGLTLEQAVAAMPASPAALHVGGLGLVFEPEATAVASLVRWAGPETLVLLDLNCRPGAIADEPAYRARLEEVLHRADVIKASEEDLAYLEPDRVPLEAARDLLSLGPKVVLLTRGGSGAAVIAAVGEATVSAPPACVVDTIGAGDAFGAAWLGAWIAEGLDAGDLGRLDPVISAAQFAVTVASRTCESAGAEPPYAVKVDSEWCFVSAHSYPDTFATPE